jgi:hypothetical protein
MIEPKVGDRIKTTSEAFEAIKVYRHKNGLIRIIASEVIDGKVSTNPKEQCNFSINAWLKHSK